MAPKRKKEQPSAPATNTLANAFKRHEAAAATAPQLPLEAAWTPPSAPDALLQQAASLYDEYRDGQASIAATSAAGPSGGAGALRHTAKASASVAGDVDDFEAMDQGPTQADEAVSAADVAARWEQKGAQCVEKLGRWAGEAWTLSCGKQESLLHILINDELHAGRNTSLGAYRVLQQNLCNFPAAKLLPADNGMPKRIVVNSATWTPLSTSPTCPSQLSGGFALLQRLVANGLTLAQGTSSNSNTSSNSSSSSGASQGQALLLQHLLHIMQQDLARRLQVHAAAAAEAGAATQAATTAAAAVRRGAVGSEAWVKRERLLGVLRGALLFKLLRGDLSWSVTPRSKGEMVRDLVLTIVAGFRADGVQAVGSDAGGSGYAGAGSNGGGNKGAGSDGGGGGGGGGGEGYQQPGGQLQQHQHGRAGGLGPVGAQGAAVMAQKLLVMMLKLYGTCEAAGLYADAHGNVGARDQRCNDRFELDCLLREQLASTNMPTELKDAAAVQLLLGQLPPVDALRLLAIVVAEAVARRPYDVGDKNNHVAAWHDYYVDKGMGTDIFRRGDALELLRAINDRYSWASGTLLGGKQHFTVLVQCLVSAALADGQGDAGAFREAVQQLLERMKGEAHGQLSKKDTGAAVWLGLAKVEATLA